MTNIKYDGLVEEIRTETKFLDELLKTDMEKYKRQYWYGYVSALKYVLVGSDTSLLWTHLFHGILYAPPRDKYDSLAMERAKEIMKDMIHRIDEYQQRMVLK